MVDALPHGPLGSDPNRVAPEAICATTHRIKADFADELAHLTKQGKDERGRTVYHAAVNDWPPDPEHWKCVRCNFRLICDEGRKAVAAGPPAKSSKTSRGSKIEWIKESNSRS